MICTTIHANTISEYTLIHYTSHVLFTCLYTTEYA